METKGTPKQSQRTKELWELRVPEDWSLYRGACLSHVDSVCAESLCLWPILGALEIFPPPLGSITQQSWALSLNCLPSGLFPLFTNLAGFLLWQQRRCSVPGSSYPTPCLPLSRRLAWLDRPFDSQRLLPTLALEERRGSLVGTPSFSPAGPHPCPQ